MSWLQGLVSPEKQAEKQLKKEAESQKNNGVTGCCKRRYTFTSEQKQWLAPGYLTQHTIKGTFDCGLEKDNRETGDQIWSIELRDLEFDWNEHAIPETYFLFALPWRMDVRINKSGQVINGNTWVDYKDIWEKRYKKSIFEQIKDKERAEDFYNSIKYGEKTNLALALELLKTNPLVKSLCRSVLLNYKINHDSDPDQKPEEFGERFSTDAVRPDYFYEGIHLPLKTTWIQRPLENHNQEEWSRIGGLDNERYQDQELMRLLRKTTGIFNLGVPLYVDYSEFYRMDKVDETFRQIAYAEHYTETLIKEAWMKSEYMEMILDEKGVNYG